MFLHTSLLRTAPGFQPPLVFQAEHLSSESQLRSTVLRSTQLSPYQVSELQTELARSTDHCVLLSHFVLFFFPQFNKEYHCFNITQKTPSSAVPGVNTLGWHKSDLNLTMKVLQGSPVKDIPKQITTVICINA